MLLFQSEYVLRMPKYPGRCPGLKYPALSVRKKNEPRLIPGFDDVERKTIMTEQLLTPRDAARKLAIGRSTFYQLRQRLIANGMEYVVIGGIVKYRQSSIDKLIADAAERKKPIV
jgi:hypothetical protein